MVRNGNFRLTDEVLDAGGGQASGQLFLAAYAGKVVNVDNDVASLAKTKEMYAGFKKFQKVELVEGDLKDLSMFPDGRFDKVVCISVLEHDPDYMLILKELWRVLKPGGRLLVTMDVATFSASDHLITDREAARILCLFGMDTLPPIPEDAIVCQAPSDASPEGILLAYGIPNRGKMIRKIFETEVDVGFYCLKVLCFFADKME
jgi:SAM-dependent methyltransferase